MDTKEYPHNNYTIEDPGQSWDIDADWGSSFGKALFDSKKNGAKKLSNKSYSKVKEKIVFQKITSKKMDTIEGA